MAMAHLCRDDVKRCRRSSGGCEPREPDLDEENGSVVTPSSSRGRVRTDYRQSTSKEYLEAMQGLRGLPLPNRSRALAGVVL